MSMPEVFDPYRKWLGIPPAEQPPSHYRLLGVGAFEDDADTIASAADRQMAHLRTFQTGPHSELSQKLLNELSAARLTLLDTKKKAAYDEQLRAQLAASTARADGAGQGRGAPSPKPLPTTPVSATTAEAGASRAAPPPVPVGSAAVPAAGQGRGAVAGNPLSISISSGAARPTAPARRAGRRRSRHEPAPWAGVASAAIVLGVVIYIASNKLKTETTTSVAVQKAPPVTSADTDRSSADGQPSDERSSERETAEDLSSSNSPDDESAARDAASLDNLPIAEQPNRSDGKMPNEGTNSSGDNEPAQKPRSLADLASHANRPQLPQTRRETPPEGKELAAAGMRFAQLYGKDVAGAKRPEAVGKLVIRLDNLARQGADTADVRYVMLGNAGTLAANLGNVGLAYRIAVEIARQFDVDAAALKLKALEAAGKNATAPGTCAIGVLQALALADRAVAEGRSDVASRAATLAALLARKTKNKELMAQADRCKAGLRDQSARNAAYKTALANLKKTPDDRELNLAAGKYEVLVLGEWQDGLTRLALSGEPWAVEIAHLEVAARADLSEWAPLAAAWWQAGQLEDDDFFKLECQLQAKYAYSRAWKAGRAGGVSADIAAQLKELAGYASSRLQPGIAARYFDGADFQSQRVERADAQIFFFFGEGSPDPSVSNNFFSARWTGFFKPPVSGRYLIVTHTDDSVRLWVDGKQVLNRWGQAARWQQVELELSDELHTFRMDYNETHAEAIAMLGWTLADFPDLEHRQWSPIDALYYDPESPFDLPE